MKLSEKLEKAAAQSQEWTEGFYTDDLRPWAADARALEERVAELEGRWAKDVAFVIRERDAATARAEAAEAERTASALRAKLEKYEACCALNSTTCGNNYCCGEGDA